ncbi:MAG: NAD(P)/FAD-dependent oxidoreductase [Armatimonadota bacterium]
MRVGIIGAGPAGAACALALLYGARQRGQQHDVLLIDGKSFVTAGPRGCNMCAGVISVELLDYIRALGVEIPSAVVQREISSHFFEARAGNVRIPKDPASSICTVFRSAGPRGETPDISWSFDNLLLRAAVQGGATHLRVNVAEIHLPISRGAPYRLETADGRVYEVDAVVGAFGVNSALIRQVEQLGFGYRRPQTYHACQAEIPLDPAFIEAYFHNEIKVFSLGLPGMRFGALTPKRRHVTVSVIGKEVGQRDLERFLSHPRVRAHFPDDWQMPASYCHCHPRLPISPARKPVADRFIVIGDAHISRYLKGGIDSAFFTASLAAEMILAGTLSRRELEQGYIRRCYQKYRYDNWFGRILFFANDLISRIPFMTRLGIRLIRDEQTMPTWTARHHTQLLWHIFAGDAPYRQLFFAGIHPRTWLDAVRVIFHRKTVQPEDDTATLPSPADDVGSADTTQAQ